MTVPISKKAIVLSGVVGEDRQLKVSLPDDVPAGQVELIIMMAAESGTGYENDRLSRLRTRLEAKGYLKDFHLPDPTVEPAPLTDAQLLELGKLSPGSRPSHDLINEDREDRV
jgi:hypothetical protein